MDRLNFIGQTYQGSSISIDDIVKFFDHTMAAYESIGNTDDVTVHGIIDGAHSLLLLQVQPQNQSELSSVVDRINSSDNSKQLYGRTFFIRAEANESLVNVYVQSNDNRII